MDGTGRRNVICLEDKLNCCFIRAVRKSALPVCVHKNIFLCQGPAYFDEGEAEEEGEGEGAAAFPREVLMAFKSTIEVYLLSSA